MIAILSDIHGNLVVHDLRSNQRAFNYVFTASRADIRDIHFSSDGRRLAASTYGGNVRAWDAGTWKQLSAFDHNHDVPDVSTVADVINFAFDVRPHATARGLGKERQVANLHPAFIRRIQADRMPREAVFATLAQPGTILRSPGQRPYHFAKCWIRVSAFIHSPTIGSACAAAHRA